MLNQTSTTAIVRIVLLAGILLAFAFLASRSFFPAFAQETETLEYAENRTDTVAAYTASDPEGEDITWTLSGPDLDDFNIDGGVVTFKSAPDFEGPTDDGTDNTLTLQVVADDNEYVVIIEAEDANGTTATKTLRVTVTNVEETGTVTLSTFQPKVGVAIMASLTDDDGGYSCTDLDATKSPSDKNLGDDTDTKWQWATSTPDSGVWNDIDHTERSDARTDTYIPRESDVGKLLRATATYCDGYGEDDPFTPDMNELMDEQDAVSANAVVVKDYTNTPPEFPDQNPDPDARETAQTREMSEDASVGDPVGDPVVAEDKGADGSQESLTYTLVDGNPTTPGDPEESFTIDRAKGQIRVGADANLNFEADTSADADDQDEYIVTVRAADPSDTDNTPSMEDVIVTITVTNVNDDPIITRNPTDRTEFEFDENGNIATALRTFEATDEDAADNFDDGTLKWSVARSTATSRNDSGRFKISPGGALTFASQPDFDSPWNSNNTYKVKVVATDRAGRTDSEELTIAVRNFDEPGTVTMSNRQAEVGTEITARLKDEDGRTGTVTWEWDFNGTVVTQENEDETAKYTPLDAHVNATLEVTARYKNADGIAATAQASDDPPFVDTVQPEPTTSSPNVAPKFVGVAACNDAATKASTTKREVDEHTATDQAAKDVGAAVGFCDTDDNSLTYSLSGGDTSAFEINRTNGQLRTKAILNYETKRRYSVTVRAHDPSNANSTVTVMIDIGQVNEPPMFTEGDTTLKYAEGSRGTHLVDTYRATDPEGVSLTWTKLGEDGADDFDFVNGVLSFKQAPDYEAPVDQDTDNTYEVTLQISDGTEANDRDRIIRIEVTNVDEDGVVTLSSLNPKEGVSISAELSDPDGSAANRRTVTNLTDIGGTKWQWYRSSSRNGPWTEIKAAETADGNPVITSDTKAYTPSADDVRMYLRAGAKYIDGHSPSRYRPDKARQGHRGRHRCLGQHRTDEGLPEHASNVHWC